MKRDLEEGQLKSNYDLHVAVQQLIINTCDNSPDQEDILTLLEHPWDHYSV